MTSLETKTPTRTAGDLDVVRELYAAVKTADPAVVTAVLDKHFASDIVVHEADSLPWGGTYSGLDAISVLATGMTNPASPVDVRSLEVEHLLVESADISGDSHVVAILNVPFRGPSTTLQTRVLEWFTFRHGKVTRIDIFLDTASVLAVLNG